MRLMQGLKILIIRIATESNQAVVVRTYIAHLIYVFEKCEHCLRWEGARCRDVLRNKAEQVFCYVVLNLYLCVLEHMADVSEIQIIHKNPNRHIAVCCCIMVNTGRMIIITAANNIL